MSPGGFDEKMSPQKKLYILTFGNPLIKLENLANVLRTYNQHFRTLPLKSE